MNKQCTKCGETKAFKFFHKNKASKDDLTSRCKVCIAEQCKNWHINNRERSRLKAKEQTIKHKDRIRNYEKQFRLSKKNGKYHVYLLPEEHYCGQTAQAWGG